MADFSKIVVLEKAKREVERDAIDDNLKALSGRPDFDLDALISEYYIYFFYLCPALFTHNFDSITYTRRRRGSK